MDLLAILAILFALISVGCLGYFIFRIIKLAKTHVIGEAKYKIQGKERILYLSLVGGAALSLALCFLFLELHNKYPMNFLEFFVLIIGCLLTGGALTLGVGAFILNYYKLDLDDKQKKFCRIAWPIALAVFFLGLLLASEGVAKHIGYPLVSGISTADGWLYGKQHASGGIQIKFYGILIVSGALICYAITDHMTYKKFKKHGLIDTLFIVAFLFGILGARLWYCFVLEPDKFLANPAAIIMITDGGLAIQGGAILGIAAGVTFMLVFRKYIDLRFMMDVAIPTILIAQAVGRWGNFFNQEVYGQITDVSHLWYLPTIVKNNMFIGSEYRVPLFFIESTINLGGFFFIRYFLGKVCRCHVGLGYQASAYLIWYGLVRVILEPFRDGYNGTTESGSFGYLQSYLTAFIMIGIGVLMIVGFFIYHYLRMKKGIEDKFGDKI